MIHYQFIKDPTPHQTGQIIGLYRLEGWWSESQPDDPDHVARLILGSHCFLVAMDQEDIVAMGRAISDGASDAYLQDVTVHPAFRRKGIGTQIISKLMTRLQNDGIRWIGLIAEKQSHPFYEPLGFFQMPNAVPMLNQK